MNAPDSVIYMGMALVVYVAIELLAIFFKWLW